MDKMQQARLVIGRLDEQAEGTTMIHRLHPLAKLLIAIVFIGITTSYSIYDLFGVVLMFIFVVIWYLMADLSLGQCMYRMRYVMPLIILMALPNPFLDRAVMYKIGQLEISHGMISMVTLIIKGMLCLSVSYLLVATTSIEEMCKALRCIHVPAFLTTLILLTYRFVSILLEEVSIMTDAYKLRAPGQKGIAFAAWGSFLGQLIIRSSDRAQNLYESMVLRGYNGEIDYAGKKEYLRGSALIAVVTIVLMIVI